MNASGIRDGTLDQGVHLLQSNVTIYTADNTQVLARDGRVGTDEINVTTMCKVKLSIEVKGTDTQL